MLLLRQAIIRHQLGCHHQAVWSTEMATRFCIHRTTTTTTTTHQSFFRKNKTTLWFATATAGTAAFAYYQLHHFFGGSEGLYRALSFYSLAIPVYMHYRFHQAVLQTPASSPLWDDMDRSYSQQGLAKILELRGFYIKCGQMAAANVGNGFPVVWQQTMRVLQDQCPAVDYTSVIRPILVEAFHSSTTFPLTSVDPEPIGTASIGQVHRGRLVVEHNKTTTTEPVVIKVCLPHAERLLRGDVRTILAFCQLAQPVHVPNLRQVEEQLVENELDYRKEAEQLEMVRANMMKAKLNCWVPRPYREYCTQHVLVMEELVGVKLVDALLEDAEKWKALAKKYGDDDYIASSNEHYDVSRILEGLETQRRVHNAVNGVYNWTVGWVAPSRPYRGKEELPLDHAKLVDDIFHIHGHQVLVDGRFNADCHPGNILLCRKLDGDPILGLIDYGQVKVLTKDERLLLCKIIIALDDENKEELVRLMTQAGFQSKHMDPEVIWLYSKVNYDEDNSELTNGQHIQLVRDYNGICMFGRLTSCFKFMEELQSRDPIIDLPKPYLMVSRASILLRGLAHSLRQSRSVAKEWRSIAERVLREEGEAHN